CPDGHDAPRPDQLLGDGGWTGFAVSPLEMRGIRLGPVPAPFAAVALEDLGDLAEPGIAGVPTLGRVDDVHGEPVPVPAAGVVRRIGDGLLGWFDRSAALVIDGLKLVGPERLVDF